MITENKQMSVVVVDGHCYLYAKLEHYSTQLNYFHFGSSYPLYSKTTNYYNYTCLFSLTREHRRLLVIFIFHFILTLINESEGRVGNLATTQFGRACNVPESNAILVPTRERDRPGHLGNLYINS